jgi:starvation-inducible DNA-binding protein
VEINTGIAEPARQEIAGHLSTLLADTYTLYLKTHIYHWNVTGPMFNSLHLMFEGQYLELRDAVDEVAERIRALGHLAPLGYADFARLSTISDDIDAPEALEMVRRLATGHEAVVRTARRVVAAAEEAGDVASADLATQRIHIHEKTAWMLRATVE